MIAQKTIKKKLFNPYLIQRGKMKDETDKNKEGIGSLVAFHYMGSSEFEFEALPKALGQMKELNKNNRLAVLHSMITHISGQGLFVISTREDIEDIINFLRDQIVPGFSKRYYRLKESTYLDNITSKPLDRVNFWWDIQNNWMAVFGKRNAYDILKTLI